MVQRHAPGLGALRGDERDVPGSACFVAYRFEQAGNPMLAKLGVETRRHRHAAGRQHGRQRSRASASRNSALFATVTTDASCGAVNSMHDSFTPLGGLVPLFNMQTGEVIFGGVGAGLYGMLLFAILAVFIAGLMVGRTPEYLGKKIEQKEVKMAMLAMIATAFSILVFTGAQLGRRRSPKDGYWNPPGPAIGNLNNAGPHGFSEILYAYTSGTGNNGSAFAGITVNTPWYNLTIGLAMLIGRFLFMIPLLAAAGSLARRRRVPVTSGTLPTHGALFVGLLVGDGRDRRRADVLPGAVTGPDRRALPDAPGTAVLDGADRSRTGDAMAVTARLPLPAAPPRRRLSDERRCSRRSWRARGRCSIREIVARAPSRSRSSS